MDNIAIDVVLLPPYGIRKMAIQENRKLVDTESSSAAPILLQHKKNFPHLSLLMGGLQTDRLLEVNRRLVDINRELESLALHITARRTKEGPQNQSIVEYVVDKTPPLQQLHETIVKNLKEYLHYDISKSMFAGTSSINDFTVSWVKNFLSGASFQNFHPHITLGVGNVDHKKINTPFIPKSLGICHLGNYCTCKNLIFQVDLIGESSQ